MEQDQGLGAGIQHEVAIACLDGHAAIYHPYRDALPVRDGGAEYQPPAAEIQQVIEAREKLLSQHSLDVGRQCMHGLHSCEQEFLIGSLCIPSVTSATRPPGARVVLKRVSNATWNEGAKASLRASDSST